MNLPDVCISLIAYTTFTPDVFGGGFHENQFIAYYYKAVSILMCPRSRLTLSCFSYLDLN